VSPAVPRRAVVFEGDDAHVMIAHEDQSVELRSIKIGLSSGDMLQVLEGLRPGEQVITGGNLFIDRVAAGAGT
jgi:membrane fusion protein, heavy metal efflux system